MTVAPKLSEPDVAAAMNAIGLRARAAARAIANAPPEQKTQALRLAGMFFRASARRKSSPPTRATSPRPGARDLTAAMIDRLTLDDKRIEAMARGVEEVAELPDPVGRVLATFARPNGLVIERVATPLGVVGVIYESRPNVTADAGALCLKSGNAVVLRGGSDSFHSSAAIHACLVAGLREAGLPEAAISRAPFAVARGGRRDAARASAARSTSSCRAAARASSSACSARRACRSSPISRASCTSTSTRAADLDKALRIVVNSKMRRTGVCGAAETLLVDRAGAPRLLKPLIEALIDAGCEVRGDAARAGRRRPA